MSEIGRVKKVDGDMVYFFITGGKPCFGQIVKIPSGDRVYYTRVTKPKSESTLELTYQMKESEGREAIGKYSSYEEAESALFLQKHGGRTRVPTYIPVYQDPVQRIGEDDYTSMGLYKGGDLRIGRLRSGEELLGEVGIEKEAISRHMCTGGTTGSGKSVTNLLIHGQILDRSDIVGLIFDFAGEMLEGKMLDPPAGLKDHPNFRDKVQYFSVEDKNLVIGLQSVKPQDLTAFFEDMRKSPAQRRAAKQLFDKYKDNWISTSVDLYEDGELKKISGVQKKTLDALLGKIRDFKFRPDLFPVSKENFINKVKSYILRGKTCLIDISGLDHEDQMSITDLTASAVSYEYKQMFEKKHTEWSKLPHLLITLEEAHEFLHEKVATIFTRIAMTYRKYHVGLNAVTPNPELIDRRVYGNLWTKIIMKTELVDSRNHVTRNTPYLEHSDTEIKMLDRGEALLVSEPKIRFAVPIKVIYYPEYLKEIKEKAEVDRLQKLRDARAMEWGR